MGPIPVSEPRITARPRLLILLASLLYIEALAVAALTVLLIVDAVIQNPDSYLSAVALGLFLGGGLTPIDNGLRDLRFAAQPRSASGDIVFVDIDSIRYFIVTSIF